MSNEKKYKLIVISDMPLIPSGVALQARYIVDRLVKSDRIEKIICLGAAMKHGNYTPIKYEPWGEKALVIPVDGYVPKDLIRQIIDVEKVDAIFFITDPRFYIDLWAMEDEIHSAGCALIYNHLWDNADQDTWPKYNSPYYNSTDFIGCINKLTYKFLKENGWGDKSEYIPHGVPADEFFMMSKEDALKAKASHLGDEKKDDFILFYNSRNALRKRTGNVVMAWKYFLEKLSPEDQKKCLLCMKTPPKDHEGQDLFVLVNDLNLKERVAFADKMYEPKIMNEFYNLADCTISLSSEEGFGLSILESLMCGTPVICTKTGGMQDQVIDDETDDVFGLCLEPDASSLIGSQTTPYIWSHHIDPHTAAEAIYTIWQRYKEKGDHKDYWGGEKARKSVMKRFNLKDVQEKWHDVIVREIEKFKEKQLNKTIRMNEI